MKKLILAFMVLSGCTAKVPAGNVGIKVYLLGGSKGVDIETLPVGRYYVGWNEDLFIFPTFQQNYTWTKSPHEGSPNDESITFQTKEGMNINVDMGVSYTLDPNKVAAIFQKYRKGVGELTDIVLRNAVRNAANRVGSGLTVEECYSSRKTELVSSIKKAVSDEFTPQGIVIENLYLVNEMRLPETVTKVLNQKIEASQNTLKIQNEVFSAEAEAKKKVAQARGEAEALTLKAEAEAKAFQLKQRAISKELVEYEAVQKWDGKLPTMMGPGPMPFLNVTK